VCISAEHATVTLLAPPRGAEVAEARALKSACFVLSATAAPGALLSALLSPGGRGVGEQLRVVQAGTSAALCAGDMLLLARAPWRCAYRLERCHVIAAAEERPQPQVVPPAPPAPAAAPAETQGEADTPRAKRQRKAAQPQRRRRAKTQEDGQ
jgi:pyruvate/2-oxoglutarate dehydrogenase complex dihydrolipoamide acyltransferase (E2) component